jgi:hypothetical protein
MPVSPLARLAVRSISVRTVVKLKQCGHLWINNCYYIPAATAIAAVGPTQWLKFFTHDGGAAVSTIAALCMYRGLVNKCCHDPPPCNKR